LLEGRGRARRRLGEAQDADQGEMVTQVMPDGGRHWSGGARVSRESGREGEASRALAGGVRCRERGMQGPVDPGEETTPDARSVSARSESAHGRAGGVRGWQKERMERTLLDRVTATQEACPNCGFPNRVGVGCRMRVGPQRECVVYWYSIQ
jgi:hypothetical protein